MHINQSPSETGQTSGLAKIMTHSNNVLTVYTYLERRGEERREEERRGDEVFPGKNYNHKKRDIH